MGVVLLWLSDGLTSWFSKAVVILGLVLSVGGIAVLRYLLLARPLARLEARFRKSPEAEPATGLPGPEGDNFELRTSESVCPNSHQAIDRKNTTFGVATMIPHPHSFLILGLLLVIAPGQQQPVPLQPGKYQVSAAITTGSAQSARPDTASRCLTARELANPEAVFNNRFMADFKPDGSCTVSNLSMAGGKVHYTTDCKYASVEITGTMTSTSYSILRKAKNKGSSGPQVETHLEGKRIGACS